ncbi:YybH family protein [Kribbella sp. CA-247076]|uniref:YybH family protein n=1 Tax=Kribbella sp. CA-247076 TaxID=3239941 RepID=UPI003D913960
MTSRSKATPSAALEAEIGEILDQRVDACRAKDIDRLMSLYSDDIVYFDVIDPLQFIGHDAVRRNFLRWFDEYDGPIGLETKDQTVAVHGDVAFVHMLHLDSGTRRNGLDLAVWVHSTVCLRHIGGRWQITHEHISIPHNPTDWSILVNAQP